MAKVCLQMAVHINEEWICERVKLNHDRLGNTAYLNHS